MINKVWIYDDQSRKTLLTINNDNITYSEYSDCLIIRNSSNTLYLVIGSVLESYYIDGTELNIHVYGGALEIVNNNSMRLE